MICRNQSKRADNKLLERVNMKGRDTEQGGLHMSRMNFTMFIQGGSNTTGTDLCVNKCKLSRSYLNHLVHKIKAEGRVAGCRVFCKLLYPLI